MQLYTVSNFNGTTPQSYQDFAYQDVQATSSKTNLYERIRRTS